MFLASCVAGAIMVAVATVNEDGRLRQVLAPSELSLQFREALHASGPLPVHAAVPRTWCRDVLYVLSERILAKAMGDRTGDTNANGFQQAFSAGRLAVTLQAASGQSCAIASEAHGVMPALREQMAMSAVRPGPIIDRRDGWISAVTVVQKDNQPLTLTVGVHVLSPYAKLMQPRTIFRPLSIFILSINALSALVLVFMLIRRIKRANKAAAAWAAGELDARIGDAGQDEFSKLSHRFDRMADALAGVIEVKQALAAAEERNRVARDLHDSAKQRAFALNLQLSAAQKMLGADAPGGRVIDAALSLTNQLQQDLANVIRRLTAPTIAETGFRHVLTEAVQTMLTGSPVRWSLSLGTADERELAMHPEIVRELFLITIEATANVLKHASATHCAIVGERTGESYVWRIKDNGNGMSPDVARTGGMGLPNMKLRAASLPEGAIAVYPNPDGGMTVDVNFRLTTPEQT